MICHVCQDKRLHKFLSLGSMPLANGFLREDQLSVPEPYYPLDVYFCESCGLVQLGHIVPPEILFKNYPYLTSESQTMRDHFAELVDYVIQRYNPPKKSLIVDIGSNDGTLLQNFRKNDFNILGIEPATNIASLAIERGIETVNDFFCPKSAQQIRTQRGEASLIFGTNVFAHVEDLKSLLYSVSHLLSKSGVFIIEVPYVADMLKKLEFDTIYHEHLRYFAVRPLITLFGRFGMSIIDVEHINVHGGSLRVYVQKSIGLPLSSGVAKFLESEQEVKLDSLETYVEFAEAVSGLKEKLLRLLKSLKAQRARIVGYGAPAKGNVLLNYCKIGTDILDYIVDTTQFKQYRYTPGMHIPVFPEGRFHEAPPDYALLLAWNYSDEILHKEEGYRQAGGKFIVPIPKLQMK